MKSARFLFLVGCLLCAGSASADGQDTIVSVLDLPYLTRVRIAANALPSRYLTGRVAHFDEQRIDLAVTDQGSVVSVPRREIRELSWSLGIDRDRGMWAGVVVGAGAGTYVSKLALDQIRGCGLYCAGLGPLVISEVIVVMYACTLVGALSGANLAIERWHPAPLALVADSARPAADAYRVELRPGEYVRLRVAAAVHDGRALHGDQNALTLVTPSDTASFDWRSLSTLSVRGGRDRVAGAVSGAAIAGTLAGAVYVASRRSWNGFQEAGVVTLGAALGAGIGQFLGPRLWIKLPLPSR